MFGDHSLYMERDTSYVTKGLAKLGNIFAETMFLVMVPGVVKLGNICFRR